MHELNDNIAAIINDTGGIFGLDLKHSQVTINSRATMELKLNFKPLEPINYYKRIFCAVQNEDVQYIDLIGTAYNSKSRPPDMSQKHIDISRNRVNSGYNMLPPEALEEISLDDISPDIELLAIDKRHSIYDQFFDNDHTRDEVGINVVLALSRTSIVCKYLADCEYLPS